MGSSSIFSSVLSGTSSTLAELVGRSYYIFSSCFVYTFSSFVGEACLLKYFCCLSMTTLYDSYMLSVILAALCIYYPFFPLPSSDFFSLTLMTNFLDGFFSSLPIGSLCPGASELPRGFIGPSCSFFMSSLLALGEANFSLRLTFPTSGTG